jgi:hypothetical protein
VLRDSSITSGIGQFGVIQAMAPLLMVEVSHVNVRDATEIERSSLEVPATVLARADEVIE